MPNYGAAVRLNKIPAVGLVPETAGTAPSSPVLGQLWTDSSTSKTRWWNGSVWVAFDDVANGTIDNARVATGAAIALSKLATDPLARANHTGTQASSTISDLATAVKAYRLDEFAAPTSSLNANNQKIVSVANGTNANDAVNVAQLQSAQSGIDNKPSVRAATTANGTLATAFANGQVIDGVTLATGDRILIKNQTTVNQNGLYVVAASGAPTRTDDTLTANTFVFVEEGSVGADTSWMITNNGAITPGTTDIVWGQFGSSGSVTAGGGLTLTGNTLDVVAADGSITVAADSITVGLVPVSKGGTNATTAADARTNLSSTSNPMPQKYSQTFSTSAGTPLTITHNLDTFDVDVSVWDAVGASKETWIDVDTVTSNTLTVTTAAACTNFRIVVIG